MDYTKGTLSHKNAPLRRPTPLDGLKPNIMGYDMDEEDIFDRRMEWVGRGLGVLCVVLLGVFFWKLLA